MANAELTNGGTTGTVETSTRTVTVTPRVDVLETEDGFVMLADMPGVKPEDVDIRFEKGELTLHGRRPATHNGRQSAHREHDITSYQRTFAVADTVASDRIEAELRNGVLTVRLPKVEAVKPKKIEVRG